MAAAFLHLLFLLPSGAALLLPLTPRSSLCTRASARCLPPLAYAVKDNAETAAEKAKAAAPDADLAPAEPPQPQPMSLMASTLVTLLTLSAVITFLLAKLRYTNNYDDGFLDLELPEKLAVLSKVSWLPGRGNDAQATVALVMAVAALLLSNSSG